MQFHLTEDHLKLLRHVQISWCGDEFGAPTIDPKRPYGNSDVYEDMREILNNYPDDLTDEELRQLHEELRYALEIVVNNAGECVQLGTYKKDMSTNYSFVKID
jgi:hypothetical protein